MIPLGRGFVPIAADPSEGVGIGLSDLVKAP